MTQDNPFHVETNVLDPDYSTATPTQISTAVTNTLLEQELEHLDTLESVLDTVIRSFLNANETIENDNHYTINHLLLILTQNGSTIDVLQDRVTSQSLNAELDIIAAMDDTTLDPLTRRVLEYSNQPTMERFNEQFDEELNQLTT